MGFIYNDKWHETALSYHEYLAQLKPLAFSNKFVLGIKINFILIKL